MSSLLPDFPDPALRQPATLVALAPLFLSIYAQAVFAILPNTFILKLSLLPFIVWQAWSCAVGLSFSMAVAKWLGFENDEQIRSWNFQFVTAILVMSSKSIEWTFIKKPLRKYEWPEGQDPPVERPLSMENVLLDALDLFFNHRGIRWSWSSRPFPRQSTPPPSIASVLAKTLVKFTVLDTSQYILHLMNSPIDKTGGVSLFDANIPFLPRTILVLFAAFLFGLWTYAQMECFYHVAMLIGRILLRQPASQWPPFARRPWMATSVRDMWSVRCHQFFRHFFIVFGARPGAVLLGRPGAVMGGFAVSGLMHAVGLWATGHVMGLSHQFGFYLIMSVGVVLESAFEQATRSRVRGFFGWLWTMAWTLPWCSHFLGLRVQGGPFPVESFPDHLRPGKMLINGVISLFSKCM